MQLMAIVIDAFEEVKNKFVSINILVIITC